MCRGSGVLRRFCSEQWLSSVMLWAPVFTFVAVAGQGAILMEESPSTLRQQMKTSESPPDLKPYGKASGIHALDFVAVVAWLL
eukprot:COSAG06_NODE_3249_length_5601_cov_271.643466_2_plen_83_part_00